MIVEHTFQFNVSGTTAEGVSWACSGQVTCETVDVWTRVLELSFRDLTRGRAVFGRPGVGCKGPYEVQEVSVKRIDGHAR